ncbi:MAG TPA: biopolymer transporter ExbD [Bacteroidales bacterium]|nr:biopolymer transporter ExbD [Bacteroidales bacterium]HPT02958.1 biopolymer transporter ExbD [Bacteroidales bacterium]
MARFKRSGSRSTPGINTGSMSDIIFMFLFFFMVITTIREVTLEVKVLPPQASEVQKLEKKSLVSFIYIGQPRKVSLGTESRIQLNNQFASVGDIQSFVAAERASRDESEKNFITTSLKVDMNTRMGIVTDVKQELRNAGAFKINYSTRKLAKKSED